MKSLRSFLPLLALLLVTPVYAALSYGDGVYTNLCGTGFAATADTCNVGCNTGNGTCSASSPNVVKWTCDGRLNECRGSESSWSTFHSLSGTSCGKTVQIDVFDKQCRVNGNWVCGDSNLKDYMVWYSGDCAPQPTTTTAPTSTPVPTGTPRPTNTPAPTSTLHPTPTSITYQSSCDSLTVLSGNNAYAPETVRLRARGTDTGGTIQAYKFYFGDGNQEESTNAEASHRYESAGTYSARVDVKDSRGVWKTSSSCESTVTLKSLPIESHRSGCSDLFIKEGNYTQAPTSAKFDVTGFDNKGAVKKYKMDFGIGIVKESDTGTFEQIYNTPGTYTVKGYIMDSQGEWKGGVDSCTKQLYVNTIPLTTQPSTGTPTALTVLALGSGLLGFSIFAFKKFAIIT